MHCATKKFFSLKSDAFYRLLPCIVLIFSVVFCINKTTDFQNPSGIFGFGENSFQVKVDQPLIPESLGQLRKLKNIILITDTNHRGSSLVYDPSNYFYNHSDNLKSEQKAEDFYFTSFDYAWGSDKKIGIDQPLLNPAGSQPPLECSLLSDQMVISLQNFFAESSINNTTIYVSSSSEAELQAARNLFTDTGFHCTDLPMQVPALLPVIQKAFHQARTSLISVWGILVFFLLCLISKAPFEEEDLLSETDDRNKKKSLSMPKIPVQHSGAMKDFFLIWFAGFVYCGICKIPAFPSFLYSLEMACLSLLLKGLAGFLDKKLSAAKSAGKWSLNQMAFSICGSLFSAGILTSSLFGLVLAENLVESAGSETFFLLGLLAADALMMAMILFFYGTFISRLNLHMVDAQNRKRLRSGFWFTFLITSLLAFLKLTLPLFVLLLGIALVQVLILQFFKHKKILFLFD